MMRACRNLYLRLAIATLLAMLVGGPAGAKAPEVPDSALSGLSWRLLGPHRAGWGTVGAGVPDQPDTFYFGAAGGGVWRTIDSGRTWVPIFDHGPASIGALAIAPSNSKVIYVGTGQISTRYDIAAGEGMFRSDDAGVSWQRAGLEHTRHIGEIWIDPRDERVAVVAALGHAFGANPERGVFRTEDGGRSWQRTLFVSENTGAVDVAADPKNPDVLFAAAWQMRFKPWLSYFTPDTGSESGVYRSTDSGRNWTRLQGHGWPTGKLGRIGLASTSLTGGTRVYAVVDADQGGGLYRSDDAGDSWRLVNGGAELISGYFAKLTVMPNDPDTVFVMGRSIHRCGAGGTTCTIVKGSPGGDDYHHLWINPRDPRRMITSSDQGTVVSVNGGETWSSWYNQPTGQLYHLAADNRFPYWIYAGQQDNGTVAIASRSDYGSISYRDWHPVGADERDYDIPDPRDSNIVYGSGLGGRLSRWDARTGEVQNISPWPVSSYGARPTSVKYRYTWITPIAVSAVAPHPLYQGAQVLFRSLDGGASWQTISPDLSGHKSVTTDCSGDLEPARARDCGYGVIFSIGLSPRDNDEIWIGTDDGLVQLTRDGGRTWTEVTPKGVPPWARIITVDVSALDPGTAYVAVDNHRQDEFVPMIWRTRDYGRTWISCADGLPTEQFVSAVRADLRRRGLLYAGTDRGVFVSFDDGAHWQSLQRNLPSVLVTDLLVHADDLVVATQGRAIWALDDLAPLRDMGAIHGNAVHLFAPSLATRVRRNQNKDTPLPPEEPVGRNPPAGAVIDYWLASDVAGPVSLEIRDSAGTVVRRHASDDQPMKLAAEKYFADRWVKPAEPLSTRAGAHRVVWDLHYARPRASQYNYSIAAIDGEDTPLLPEGLLAPAGDYVLVLTAARREYRAPLKLRADPRSPLDSSALAQTVALSKELVAAIERHYVGLGEVNAVRKQLDVLVKATSGSTPTSDSVTAASALKGKTDPLVSAEGVVAPNLTAIGDVLIGLQIDLEGTDRAPTQAQRQTLSEYGERLDRALALWSAIKAEDLVALNRQLRAAKLPLIAIPAAGEIRFTDPGVSKEMP